MSPFHVFTHPLRRAWAIKLLHLFIAFSLILPQLTASIQLVQAMGPFAEAFTEGELTPTASPSVTPDVSPTPIGTAPFLPTVPITSTLTSLPTNTPTPTETASPTSTATAMPTATSVPTSTLTATPTMTATHTSTAVPPTPTPTVTPSATPTGTPTSVPTGTLTVTLGTTPTLLVPGFPMYLSWEGAHWPTEPDTELVLTVPEGFTPTGTLGNFDPISNTLTLTSTTAVGGVAWQIAEDAYGPYPFQLELFVEATLVISVTTTVEEYGVFGVPEDGGQATGLEGRVSVTVPEGALPEAVDLRIQPVPPGNLPYSLSGQPFQLTALGQASGQEITQFSEALTVTVAYDESRLAEDENALLLFYYDETLENWMSLPSWVDPETNQLIAKTDHFTGFDIDALTWQSAQLPTLDAFQVSSFTGAATYSLSIWTPPGPGGLQPSVSLSYNSQSVDGANARTQAGIAGMGWSLSAGGAIQRNMNGTEGNLTDDTFSFVAGGVSSTLLPIAEDGSKVEFRTADESFWRIYGYKAGTNNFSYWEAWDKTGTKYTFGGTAESKADFPHYSGGGSNCYLEQKNWYWGLSATRNIHNVELTYVYDPNLREDTHRHKACDGGGNNGRDVVTAVYLTEIQYPNDKYRVVFTYTSRNDYDFAWINSYSSILFERKKLSEIYIQHNADDTTWETGDEKVRRYVLTYETTTGKHIFPNVEWPYNDQGGIGRTPTLIKIQEYGKDGSTLPPTTFFYDDRDGNWNEQGEFMHLFQAENGYGGKVEFVYEALPWFEHTNDPDSGAQQDFEAQCPSAGYNPGWVNVNSWTEVDCTNDYDIKIFRDENNTTNPLEVRSNLAPSHIRPGAFYQVVTNAFGQGGPFWLGLDDGSEDSVSDTSYGDSITLTANPVQVVQYFQLDTDASSLSTSVRVKCNPGSASGNWCKLDTDFRATPLTTIYRVSQKKLYDGSGAAPLVYSYTYDEPATNDTEHSAAVDEAFTTGDGNDDLLSSQYSEYRGNSWVRSQDPAGLVNYQWFHQDDDRSGTGYTSLALTQNYWQPFDSSADWNTYESQWDKTTTGAAVAVARETGDYAVQVTDSAGSWPGILRASAALTDGEIALYRFKAQSGAAVWTGLNSGTYGETDFRSLRVHFGDVNIGDTIACANEENVAFVFYNGDSEDPSDYFCVPKTGANSFDYTADQWYTVMFILDSNNIRVRLWAPGNPTAYEFVCTLANDCPMTSFSGKSWKMMALVNRDAASGSKSLWFDEYSEGVLYSLSAQAYTAEASPEVEPLLSAHGGAGGNYFDHQAIVWNHLDWQVSQTFEGNGEYLQTGTFYNYDDSRQEDMQYGSVTQIIESVWSGTAWTDYRATRTWFYPNASPWLVSLPGRTSTYKCTATPCDFVQTGQMLSYYDGNTAYDTSPTVGKLAGVRTWLDNNGGGGSARYNTVKYAYDSWGNPTTVTNYTGYSTGTALTSPSGAQTTTTCYGVANTPTGCTDDAYYTYPLWTENASDHETEFSYETGPNPEDNLGYALGVPLAVTDPNENTTTATYDGFGRLLTILRPDETEDFTVSLSYNDTNQSSVTNFKTTATQTFNATTSLVIQKFYDGLGRLIQTQTENAKLEDGACDDDPSGTEDTCDLVVETYFDSTGRAWLQTVPFAVEHNTGLTARIANPTSANLDSNGRNNTETLYDVLGRVKTVYATDNADTNYTYGLGTAVLTTEVEDARGNSTISYTDVWGRTVEVHPEINPWTKYLYDEADRLLYVRIYDGSNNQQAETELVYDKAGRKTSMDDPDMGEWAYTYDALGNLVRQTDARGQRICFYYDALNRLTDKHYRTDNSCPSSAPANADVEYTYDEGTNGLGFRTGMEDGSGTTDWLYDSRGRLIEETKLISGEGTYATEWSYNSADMLASMKYPDDNAGGTGENVSFTYHPQGALDRVNTNIVGDADYYVEDSVYDAASRLTYRQYGLNGSSAYLNQDFVYHNWTTTNGAGRLQTMQTGVPSDIVSLQDLDYTYDAVGNVKTILDGYNSDQKQCFGYDNMNRLVSAAVGNATCSGTVGDGEYADETYTYNTTNGLLASKTGNGNYTYSTTHKHAVASTQYGGHTATYDANGNMLTRDSSAQSDEYTFTYDAENRITTVKEGTTTIATFLYDGDGNRVMSVVGGVETVYIGNYLEMCVAQCTGAVTPTPTPTATKTPTPTATKTPTVTLTPTPTATPCPVEPCPPTATPTPTNTSISGGVPTDTPSPTPTDTPTPTRTLQPTRTPTNTPGLLLLSACAGCEQVLANSTQPRPGFARARATLLPEMVVLEVPAGQVWTFYYYAGGQRVAMRTENGGPSTVHWLVGDHLGSTTQVVNLAGDTVVSTTLYKPWGEVRYQSGSLPTNYTYTGQYSESYINLLFYGSRRYDPALGRFIQPDTIVPDQYNPTSWDRFAYTINNPVKYIDPTGHFEECPGYDYGCGNEGTTPVTPPTTSSKPLEKLDDNNAPPDWWSIFTYDTLNVHGVLELKLIAGVELLPRMSINLEALRNFDINSFDFSIGFDVSLTLGLSGSADAMIYAQGSDGSVLDQSNYLIGKDGGSVNLDACDTVCLGAETTLNPWAENGFTSNVGYGIGAGYGVDFGVDLIRGGLDIFYANQNGFKLFP